MNRIGIDRPLHGVYENVGNIWHAIWPEPIISYARVDPELPIQGSFSGQLSDCDPIFREDSFDAVTRVRRGRFYLPGERSFEWTLPHPGYGDLGRSGLCDGKVLRLLDTYRDFQLGGGNQPKIAAFGSGDSLWRVIGCERIMTGEYLFSLKARGTFGILPEVNSDAIPEGGRGKAVETLEKLADAAHRESPGSIIDRAGDAAQSCLATWAASKFGDPSLVTKTLDDLIKAIRNKPQNKPQVIATDAANIIRTLHARGKPNAQERHGTRPIMEDDAEFAVSALGFLIREFGWAEE